ncbi:hypothetical protein PHMEG_00033634 [Phytophthora megakarya]|uniref:BED-type domain-containing protein n=1 Tax=Phytophthora megakarya TaxID=4795 RepID=A0A225UT69_9STRA|nr:hypothetical protein PHMEG_00033634 [Phytophthora megakarya]
MTNKDICAYFYENLGQGRYRCKQCGSERKQIANTGYSNLIGHLANKHDDFKDLYAATLSSKDSTLRNFGFVSEETSHRFHWMRWVVERNMPLSEVDKELTRSMSKWRSVSSRVLLTSMHDAAKKIGKSLEEALGSYFALMFDGWSHSSMHYVAVYAVFEADGAVKLQLLALSPLQDGSKDDDLHIELLDGVLDVYDKRLAMVACVVGDNCSTNQTIATEIGVPLVGCASHRFNLAVNRYITENEPVPTQVKTLMSKLILVNNFAELAKTTDLHPIKRNITRWSSSFEMLERYVRIRPQIRTVEAVEELVPTGAAHRKLLELLEHMKKFQSITKKLQCDGIDLADVHLRFDSVITEYPTMRGQLNANASIVHSPVFEAATVKVINGGTLSKAEAAAVKPFEVAKCGEKRKTRQNDYATQILVAGPNKHPGRANYSLLLKELPPTSNECERFFSQCKLVLTPPQRTCMLPANFELVMFLRANRNMWDVKTLASQLRPIPYNTELEKACPCTPKQK